MKRCLWTVVMGLVAATVAYAAEPAEEGEKSTVEANRLAFVDQWVAGDLVAYGKALSGLASVKPDGLTSEPAYGDANVRYATFRFRASEQETVACVVALAEADNGDKTLYVDGDGDGKLTSAERAEVAPESQRPPDFGAAGERIWLARVSRPYERLLAFRLSPFGGTINCAVRGYNRGKLPIDGERREAVMVDANANMLLEATRDRVYVDLNGDGKLDPTSERFPLTERMEFGELAFAFAGTMAQDKVVWDLAPMGKVPVTFSIAKLSAQPGRFSATLSRKGGGVFQVTELGEELRVPAGTYIVDSLYLRVPGPGGVTHEYSFDGRDASKVIELVGEAPRSVELMGELSLSVTVRGAARPGSTLSVEDTVKTATGLSMVMHTSGGRQVPPRAVLKMAGSDEPIATGITNYG
jgi:hypothetical protein